jgi:hypothetical protein
VFRFSFKKAFTTALLLLNRQALWIRLAAVSSSITASSSRSSITASSAASTETSSSTTASFFSALSALLALLSCKFL